MKSPTLNARSMAPLLAVLLLQNVAHAQGPAIPDHPMMSDRFFIGAGVVWAARGR